MRRNLLNRILHTTFQRYLLSYLLILLVPLLIVALLFSKYLIRDYQNDLIAQNKASIHNMQTILDQQIKGIFSLLERVDSSNDIYELSAKDDAYSRYLLKKQFFKLISTDEVVGRVVYYRRGTQWLYSSDGIFPLQLPGLDSLRPETLTSSTFLQVLTASDRSRWISMEEEQYAGSDSQTYFIRIETLPQNSGNPYATVLFYIDRQALKSLINLDADGGGTRLLIADAQNRLVASFGLSGEDSQVTAAVLQSTQADSLTLDGYRYEIARAMSSLTDLQYISFIESSSILERLNARILLVSASLLLMLLAGGVLVYFSMQVSYKPVKTLSNTLKETARLSPAGGDIIGRAREAILDLARERTELSRQIEGTRPSVKHYALMRILKGEASDWRILSQIGQNERLLPESSFCVILFNIGGEDLPWERMQQGISAVEELSDSDYTAIGTLGSQEYTFVFLLIAKDSQFLERSQWFAQAREKLESMFGTYCTLGIGGVYRDLRQASSSFVEAMAALDYRFIKGVDQTIRFAEVKQAGSASFIPQITSQDYALLQSAIRQGQAERFAAILQAITQRLKSAQVPLIQLKYQCFAITDTIVRAADEIPGSQRDLSEMREVISLMSERTLDSLMAHIERFGVAVMLKQGGPGGKIAQICDYVRAHLEDADLNVGAVADRFGLSASNLSHQFKNGTGKSISEWITQLRLEQAKQLLDTTGASVGEIAQRLGYQNDSSFIKRFRQATGLTPGEYRKMRQREEELS